MLRLQTEPKVNIYYDLLESSAECDIPSDTVITDILDSYYMNVLDESVMNDNEKRLINMVHESLKIILSEALDYRNDKLQNNLQNIKMFLENSTSKFTLLQPICDIVDVLENKELMNESHYSNCHRSDIIEGLDVKMTTIEESDILDFTLELYINGYILEKHMSEYNTMMKESIEATSRDLMETSKEMSIMETQEPPSISLNLTDSKPFLFPNEDFLNVIISKIKDEYLNGNLDRCSLSREEVNQLIDDFKDELEELEDGSAIKMIGTKLITPLDYIWNNSYPETILIPYNELIKQIEKLFVTYPCDLLKNICGILLSISDVLASYFDADDDRWVNTAKNINSLVRNMDEMEPHEAPFHWEDCADKFQQFMNDANFSSSQSSGVFGLSMDFPPYDNNKSKIMRSVNDGDDAPKSKELTKEHKPSELIRTLSESFEIQKDGTIKVVVSGKSSYMDEYAENHRLLLANRKLKDYEGMKYNLVYDMILIDTIERKVLYNKKVDKDSDVYKDAVKARAHAQNDISTYLPEVKRNTKNFDLNKFYRKVKADKMTIEINGPDTISGVKRIINSILL